MFLPQPAIAPDKIANIFVIHNFLIFGFPLCLAQVFCLPEKGLRK